MLQSSLMISNKGSFQFKKTQIYKYSNAKSNENRKIFTLFLSSLGQEFQNLRNVLRRKIKKKCN